MPRKAAAKVKSESARRPPAKGSLICEAMLSRAKASNASSQVGNSGSLLSEEAQNFKRNFCQTERKTQKFVEQLEAAQDSNVEVVSFIMYFSMCADGAVCGAV